MYHFLGLVLMASLFAACQPQANIQTSLQTLKNSLPLLPENSQEENANVDVDWQEADIEADESSLDTTAAFVENDQIFAAEPVGSIFNTTLPTTIEMKALNEDEIGEPSVPDTETSLDNAKLANKSTSQIVKLAKPDSKMTVEDKSITTLKDALDETNLAAVQPIDDSAREPVIVTKPPKAPDPIHPQTIVGQSIGDLGASLGLPDFERNDADVVIWQYRLTACVADFYLYLNDGDYIVTGWAWRPPFINQTLDEEICQQQIGKLLDLNA